MCEEFDPGNDISLSDVQCPNCGATPTHTRDCSGCDEGFIDLHESDPDWYDDGDLETCSECRGSGIIHWCPECGYDFNFKAVIAS